MGPLVSTRASFDSASLQDSDSGLADRVVFFALGIFGTLFYTHATGFGCLDVIMLWRGHPEARRAKSASMLPSTLNPQTMHPKLVS